MIIPNFSFSPVVGRLLAITLCMTLGVKGPKKSIEMDGRILRLKGFERDKEMA